MHLGQIMEEKNLEYPGLEKAMMRFIDYADVQVNRPTRRRYDREGMDYQGILEHANTFRQELQKPRVLNEQPDTKQTIRDINASLYKLATTIENECGIITQATQELKASTQRYHTANLIAR